MDGGRTLWRMPVIWPLWPPPRPLLFPHSLSSLLSPTLSLSLSSLLSPTLSHSLSSLLVSPLPLFLPFLLSRPPPPHVSIGHTMGAAPAAAATWRKAFL